MKLTFNIIKSGEHLEQEFNSESDSSLLYHFIQVYFSLSPSQVVIFNGDSELDRQTPLQQITFEPELDVIIKDAEETPRKEIKSDLEQPFPKSYTELLDKTVQLQNPLKIVTAELKQMAENKEKWAEYCKSPIGQYTLLSMGQKSTEISYAFLNDQELLRQWVNEAQEEKTEPKSNRKESNKEYKETYNNQEYDDAIIITAEIGIFAQDEELFDQLLQYSQNAQRVVQYLKKSTQFGSNDTEACRIEISNCAVTQTVLDKMKNQLTPYLLNIRKWRAFVKECDKQLDQIVNGQYLSRLNPIISFKLIKIFMRKWNILSETFKITPQLYFLAFDRGYFHDYYEVPQNLSDLYYYSLQNKDFKVFVNNIESLRSYIVTTKVNQQLQQQLKQMLNGAENSLQKYQDFLVNNQSTFQDWLKGEFFSTLPISTQLQMVQQFLTAREYCVEALVSIYQTQIKVVQEMGIKLGEKELALMLAQENGEVETVLAKLYAD
ncbi:Hypothetical_protein [Hexamita inflata]|uniref:Hypothetical_protein n=1 Tax=Hexamita inflata TaxID=28002 RepID=A0AA86TI16_9EUKA|nr:Hypothetical protein HINF_LOCUS5880 [Hexamita inflata]